MPGTSTVDKHRTGGWAGTRGGLDTLEKRNIVFPCRESNDDSSDVQRAAWPTICIMNNRHNVLHNRTRQRVSFPAVVINTMPLLRYSTTAPKHCAKNICSGYSLISSQLMPMNTLRSTRSCHTWHVPIHMELLVGKVALEYVHSRNIAGTHHLTDVLEAYLHNRQAIGRPINPHSWGFAPQPALGWSQSKAITILVFFHTETYIVQT